VCLLNDIGIWTGPILAPFALSTQKRLVHPPQACLVQTQGSGTNFLQYLALPQIYSDFFYVFLKNVKPIGNDHSHKLQA
jgi:hypothetical protein